MNTHSGETITNVTANDSSMEMGLSKCHTMNL